MDVKCPNCSAVIDIHNKSDFFKCCYCSSTMLFDIDGLNLAYTHEAKVKASEIEKILKAYLVGKSSISIYRVEDIEPIYIPFWLPLKGEFIYRATSIFPEEKILKLELEKLIFDSDKLKDYKSVEVDLKLNENLDYKNSSLLYLPFYKVKIVTSNKREYTFFIGAAKAKVFAKTLSQEFNKERKHLARVFFLSFILPFVLNFFPLGNTLGIILNLSLMALLFLSLFKYLKD